MPTLDPELFKEFMKLYWLRPENGALMYYQSQSWIDVPIVQPSVDIATGEGTFVFLHCGGRFEDSFDFFSATKARGFSHDSFVDIYDTVEDDFTPLISQHPAVKFTVGTDWKSSLLAKAKKLDFFEQLTEHDNNVVPLPFHDGQFKFVHSNAIYWTSNLKELLSDIHRMLDDDGVAVLELATDKILSTLEKLRPILTPRAMSILDRKRSEEMKSIKIGIDEWSALIKNAGFTISDLRAAWPNQLISGIWDVGVTRPISHLLIRMANQLSSEEYLSIKREWVDIMCDLFIPISESAPKFKIEDAPYVTYILRK